jgi:uncharacterized protein YecT (DUF1311 family)
LRAARNDHRARCFSFHAVALAGRLALGCALVAGAAQAEDAPRQIAPDQFAPNPRDPATVATPHEILQERPKLSPAAGASAPSAAGASAPPPATGASAPPARTPVAMPTRARPYGACERTAPDWLICLAATAQLSDGAVQNTEASLLVGLERRPNLNPVMRQEIARALKGAQEAWRSLRERECAELAMIETGLTGSWYEARLVCRIRRNVERVEVLASHYSEQP